MSQNKGNHTPKLETLWDMSVGPLTVFDYINLPLVDLVDHDDFDPKILSLLTKLGGVEPRHLEVCVVEVTMDRYQGKEYLA